LIFNIKRFLSYLFVNSFIVAVLFLYGSLLFNEILAKDVAMRMATSYIDAAAYAIVIFSIVFVVYTGVYFVKARGKEFGLYLILGMTTRDLSRMILLENLVIVTGSVICGLLSGLLLSKLFYLVLGKILGVSESIYYISYKTFLLSLGVFLLVFLCNMIFTSRFLKKLSIIQITKSTSTKGTSKSRPFLGALSIVIFTTSLLLFQAVANGNEIIIDLVRNYSSIAILILVIGIFGSLYFVIALFIDCIRLVLIRIPTLYNKYILLLGNLSHRFHNYKVSLYMVSLLITLAVFFMGFGLSFYKYTEKTIDEYIPYDYMVEISGDINRISENELRSVVKNKGGKLESFSSLEFIPDVNYRNTPDRFLYYGVTSMLISESEFNRHMGLSLDIEPDEQVIVYNQKGYADEVINYDSVITIEPWRLGINRANSFREKPVTMEKFLSKLENTQRLIFERKKTTTKYYNFINSYGNVEFAGVMANIVDDSVYENIRGQRDKVYLFNLKSGDGDKIFTAILNVLRKKNNADSSLWVSAETQYGSRDDIKWLRPIYKAERHEIAFRIGGFLLFAMSFLGFLFLLSSSIVLYYKVATDIDEEKEQAVLLIKIGMTTDEYKSYLNIHLATIFFAPMVIGGILGLFLVNTSLIFTVYKSYLMGKVAIMYGVFVILDIFFYMSLKRKFVRGIGIN
jgi:ABC-type antimicrobial peptide transport system permease subunit